MSGTPGRSSSLLGGRNRYMDNTGSPSMVQRAGDSLVVRSVVTGTTLNIPGFEEPAAPDLDDEDDDDDDEEEPSSPDNLPQCKIKRNYTCTRCNFYTQNPRTYLYHLKDEHKERIRVYECPKCVYASKHSQKLQRHIHMVHVVGKQNEKLAKKYPVLAPKLPPPPPLTRAGPSDVAPRDEMEGDTDEEMENESHEAPDELEDMDDCEDDEGEEEEEDEMTLDTSAHNSSAENELESGLSTEEIKCSVCNFTSHSRTLVQRHENVAHLKKKFFRCTKCNYVTHMKARFTKHVKYHSMPMIKCDLCDFRTPYKWNLDRHYKNHQGSGEFKCPMCNFTADIKQSLTVHVQNHHLTPQQRLMRGMGRRNKVGASDAPAKELRMADVGLVGASGMPPAPHTSSPPQTSLLMSGGARDDSENDEMEHDDDAFHASTSQRHQPKIKLTLKKVKTSERRHHFDNDFIHPDDVLHKNGKVYYKNLKCNYCSFRAFWEGDILRHESKVHGVDNPRAAKDTKKRLARPIPNLIPLQQQNTSPPPAILRIPNVVGSRRSSSSGGSQSAEPLAMTEQDLNDICAKSSNSALKDFASLIGEAFPVDEPQETVTDIKTEPETKPAEKQAEQETAKEPTSKESSPATPPQSTATKRKGATSFFDKLKEKLIGQEASNLVCEHCGHESKCLSESLCHQKLHEDEESGPSQRSNMAAMVGVSSTRCQHCRHRCKTSADLLVHLQSCLSRDSTSDGQAEDDDKVPEKQQEQEEEPEPPQCLNCEQRFDTEADLEKHSDYCKPRLELNPEVSITEVKPQELHPMENKVFVWNQFPTEPNPEEMKPTLTIERIPSTPRAERQPDVVKPSDTMGDEEDEDDEYEGEGNCLVGFETAPGFGSVTNQKGHSILKPTDNASHVQKVYKCPKCNFWASAASRFHIHLVGHLNRKPFGCSQCDYRSNWRWDVAKHIRLKGVRDPAHAAQSRPRVLVHDDDSSRRNYSKYNKFLTLMTVRLGQTQSDSPPPATSLPAPPRLIPAPIVPSQESGNSRQQPLRPPPPLRAATQHVLSQLATEDMKRGTKRPLPTDSGFPQTNPANKPPEPGTKRLLWRCKKCNYRGINKDEVLAHVRTHYQNTALGPSVQITPAVQSAPTSGPSDPQRSSSSAFNCDKCPFIARWQGELHSHQQLHVPQPGAIFKCYLCPFYVGTKRELLNHMRIHGVSEPEDYLSQAMQVKMVAASKQAQEAEEDDIECSTKRYKCSLCPYETNAKAQLVYHRQLHENDDVVTITSSKPTKCITDDCEGPPYRCTICSYSVVMKHLLNQHYRVHNIFIPPARVTSTKARDVALSAQLSLDVSKAKDVPLVWAKKNGKYLKMFKCRCCPHVNLRKVNIQEHEKMHKVRKNGNTAVSSNTSDPSGMIHRCPQCTYQCNNAGVLSAHAKVHQDGYPRSCALVDPQKSDEAQLKELGGEMAETADLEDPELEQAEIVSGGTPEIITISPQLSITPAEPSNSHNNGSPQDEEQEEEEEEDTRLLYFCRQCPARFLFSRELAIHRRFHRIRLQHLCPSCTYTARQPSHLQAHAKVHTQEYQDRTKLLSQQHQMSQEHYKPLTMMKNGMWVVVEDAQTSYQVRLPQSSHPNAVQKQFACNRCPARFFKSVALSYHLTLHGGPGPYKCKTCDYAVKMYGNLVRHEPVHIKETKPKPPGEEQKPARAGMCITGPVDFVPLSGTELFQHREAQRLGNGSAEYEHNMKPPAPAQALTVDPVFGTLMHGNPKFVYPTYFKNGKMKEKRYKCHKCPSAFEKREQYKVHLSLHGSKQKYRCERCDYSVKYYANFIQHIRKHNYNDEAKQAAGDASEDDTPAAEDETPTAPSQLQRTAGKSISQPMNKFGMMPTAERQQLMLQQRRKAAAEDTLKDEQISIVPSYWCPHCPYNSMRRDGVETHSKRHVCNNPSIKTTFLCQHCDYSAPQSHFLREHNKLHFRWKPQPYGRRPETYMHCDKVELWCHALDKENDSDAEKRMIFQDKGLDVTDLKERYFPAPDSDEEEEGEDDTFIDLRTGEMVSDEQERLRTRETAPTEPAVSQVDPEPASDVESSSGQSADADSS